VWLGLRSDLAHSHANGWVMPPRRPPRPSGPRPKRASRQRTPEPSPPGDEFRSSAQPPEPTKGPDRLQKVLAHAGIGSRRACEELILQGRVTVDGKEVRELGTRVDPRRAVVAVDGQTVRLERPVYFAVSKPKGYVSTNNDPAGRPRVVDLLPEIPQRVYTVGRLDEMSVGLMILTNDGELANRLAHPKYGVEKVYRAIVAGAPAREVLDKLTEGMWLAEGKVRAQRVRPVGRKGEATVLELVLAEGKNREVRRMLARLGHKVMSLVRVSIGPIHLKGLKPGEYRPLSGHEVELLRRVAAGLPVPEGRSSRRGPDRPARRVSATEPRPPGPGVRPARREPLRIAGRPAPAQPAPSRRPPQTAIGVPPRHTAKPARRPPRKDSPRIVIGLDPATRPQAPAGPKRRPPRSRGPGGPPTLRIVPLPPRSPKRKRPDGSSPDTDSSDTS
jgi:23S rRNA pseudouridine2605 synthase